MQIYRYFLYSKRKYRNNLNFLCDMDAGARIETVLEYYGFNAKVFSEKIGLERPQAIYDIINGKTKSITEKLALKIISVFSDINKYWLLTGEGNMICQNVYDRIDRLLVESKISEREFEKGTDNINFLFGGIYQRAKNNPGDMKVAEQWVDQALKINPLYSKDWLLYGIGPVYKKNNEVPQLLKSTSWPRIPLIPIDAFCGFGTPAFNDLQIEEYYQVAEFHQADFLMRVKGNSMYPKYSSGDIVACKVVKERLFFQWNKIYAIYTNSQGVMVKRVRKSEKEDCILLVSDNERYEPFDVPLSDIEAIALVIGVIRVE